MVLHVARDRAGRRRLAEVGMLTRGDDRLVRVLPCWRFDSGPGPGLADLEAVDCGKRIRRTRGGCVGVWV